MQRLINSYRFFNLLSIDVALGAMCSALFFAKIFRVAILPYGLLALGTTVWIVYTTDHLLDAQKVTGHASTERHKFHQRHFKVLAGHLAAAVVLDGVLVYFIRKPLFVGGALLILSVGIYLLLQQYMKILKEFFVALMYTLGVLLPSVMVTSVPWQAWPWKLLAQFFLVALTNLLLFSWFDRDVDVRDGRSSFATIVGEHRTRIIIGAVLLVTVLLTFLSPVPMASLFLLLGDSVLLYIFLRSNFFKQADRFRLAGDAIFFILLLYIFI
jgi:4-hydroxybenzoate polyprenyltransferase